MGTVRIFRNLPMLATHDDVVRLAAHLGALRIAGYTADDGTKRACIELDIDAAADEIADEAERIERAARELARGAR